MWTSVRRRGAETRILSPTRTANARLLTRILVSVVPTPDSTTTPDLNPAGPLLEIPLNFVTTLLRKWSETTDGSRSSAAATFSTHLEIRALHIPARECPPRRLERRQGGCRSSRRLWAREPCSAAPHPPANHTGAGHIGPTGSLSGLRGRNAQKPVQPMSRSRI